MSITEKYSHSVNIEHKWLNPLSEIHINIKHDETSYLRENLRL